MDWSMQISTGTKASTDHSPIEAPSPRAQQRRQWALNTALRGYVQTGRLEKAREVLNEGAEPAGQSGLWSALRLARNLKTMDIKARIQEFWQEWDQLDLELIGRLQEIRGRDLDDFIGVLEERAAPHNSKLLLAIENEDPVALSQALEAGADADLPDPYGGERPLHLVVTRTRKNTAELIQRLIDYCADLEAMNNNGSTPLHRAVSAGQLLLAQQLLKQGAHINAVDAEGDTILHVIAREACSPSGALLDLLRREGIESLLRVKNNKGQTPLSLPRQYSMILELLRKASHTPLMEAVLAEDVARINALVGAGADTGAVDCAGRTALHLAAAMLNKGPVNYLRHSNLEHLLGDNAGQTPLHIAIEKRRLVNATLLLQIWSNEVLTQPDMLGKVPLHYAASNNDYKAVKLLLEAGSAAEQVAALDKDDKTPLEIAKLINAKPKLLALLSAAQRPASQ